MVAQVGCNEAVLLGPIVSQAVSPRSPTPNGGTKLGTANRLRRGRVRKLLKRLAPQAGFEPATLRLTAGCSAVELLRIVGRPSAQVRRRTSVAGWMRAVNPVEEK